MMISPNIVATLEYECPSSPSLPFFATQESSGASTVGPEEQLEPLEQREQDAPTRDTAGEVCGPAANAAPS